MKDSMVSVVILDLNEAKNIAHFLKQNADDVYEADLIDGHSMDSMPAAALGNTQKYYGCALQKLLSAGD